MINKLSTYLNFVLKQHLEDIFSVATNLVPVEAQTRGLTKDKTDTIHWVEPNFGLCPVRPKLFFEVQDEWPEIWSLLKIISARSVWINLKISFWSNYIEVKFETAGVEMLLLSSSKPGQSMRLHSQCCHLHIANLEYGMKILFEDTLEYYLSMQHA